MGPADPSSGGAGGPQRGSAPWLVLDVTGAEPTADVAAAVAEWSPGVEGVTVLVAGSRPAGLDGAATVIHADEGGRAARLRRVETGLPGRVDVVVYGDERLLAADHRGSVPAALARFGGDDVALTRGVPVTDSLRRVDERDRLRGCVDRSQLHVLHPPQVLRRDLIGRIADLAEQGDGDGSVEAGLMRCPDPVRVVTIDLTATGRSPDSAVPTRS